MTNDERKRLAGRRVELDELDAAPKAAEREPGLTCAVEREIGVNGIISTSRS